MMATEVTSNTVAEPQTIQHDELNANANSNHSLTEDVSSSTPVINGVHGQEDSKRDAEPTESNTVSAEVSVSGGSDTEASKTETAQAAADGKGHLRTESKVKKFASFKSVSVNKTFLAAKASGTTTPSKLGEKISLSSAATQSGPTSTSLRPRLVAKTGSGLRDSSTKSTLGANGGKTGAPDASAVWNKNRPAPPPEPKAYTDEELQQRYGIHMASRIQKDDGGKQANWADIDDDDDDWAPDSMEWADGTKITLPQVEEPIPEPPLPIPSPTPIQQNVPEPPKSKSPAPATATAPAPLSPAIKPGGLGSGRTGLVLTKGQTEKPTLVAKPPGPPPPVKSPWAPLPPIEKVTPVVIDIPQQQAQQSRFGRTDPHGFQGMPPPPAKEIAADDFSRTWRDGNTNSNRELFDSKSGRYEPVNDTRRGSRNDARHPSLLQRPHPSDGPAEPSAAFQTHRASVEPGYGRRRTSSNVSGGSGNLMRRMSRGQDFPQPHDLLAPRRGSFASGHDDQNTSAVAPSGQRVNSQQPWQNSKVSPVVSGASPHLPSAQPAEAPADVQAPPALSYEEQLEEQKKIMRASRELAIKRRQEAEAKEESERKERLRLKLLELGPAPEKKSKKDTPKEEKANPIPVQIQARTQQTPSAETVAQITEAPAETKDKVEAEVLTSKPAEGVLENRANGTHVLPISHLSPSQKPATEQQSSHAWQNASAASSSERLQSPWAQQQSQQTSRNVWGPPTNDRSLGNGTFDPELNSVPEMAQSNPGPIGPPSRGNAYQQQRGGREQTTARQAPIGPPNRQSYRPSPDARIAASGWANAAQIIRDDERKFYEDNAKAAALRKEQEAQGLIKPKEAPVIQDTWRQVIIGEDGKRSKVIASHVTLHNDDKPLNLPRNEEVMSRSTSGDRIDEHDKQLHRQFDAIGTQPRQPDRPVPSRSRFFPSQDVRFEQKHVEDPQHLPFERPGSPLPPPPTMPGHPVYGESAFPQVHLPRPAPVVKLPPSVLAPIGPPKPLSFAAAVATPVVTPIRRPQGATQDIRRQEPNSAVGWQDRINNLMGRKATSPPRSQALQVDSASKRALEVPAARFAATVSLPGSLNGDLSFDEDSVVSKTAAEECFEEQEMGSLPIVKVPAQAPPAAWDPAPTPKISPRNFGPNDITSVGIDSLRSLYIPYISNNTITVSVKIPGQTADAKTFSMAVPPQHNTRRPQGGRGGSRQHSHRGGRSREVSSSFSTPPLPEGGRGFNNKDRKTSNWGRSQTTPRVSAQN